MINSIMAVFVTIGMCINIAVAEEKIREGLGVLLCLECISQVFIIITLLCL